MLTYTHAPNEENKPTIEQFLSLFEEFDLKVDPVSPILIWMELNKSSFQTINSSQLEMIIKKAIFLCSKGVSYHHILKAIIQNTPTEKMACFKSLIRWAIQTQNGTPVSIICRYASRELINTMLSELSVDELWQFLEIAKKPLGDEGSTLNALAWNNVVTSALISKIETDENVAYQNLQSFLEFLRDSIHQGNTQLLGYVLQHNDLCLRVMEYLKANDGSEIFGRQQILYELLNLRVHEDNPIVQEAIDKLNLIQESELDFTQMVVIFTDPEYSLQQLNTTIESLFLLLFWHCHLPTGQLKQYLVDRFRRAGKDIEQEVAKIPFNKLDILLLSFILYTPSLEELQKEAKMFSISPAIKRLGQHMIAITNNHATLQHIWAAIGLAKTPLPAELCGKILSYCYPYRNEVEFRSSRRLGLQLHARLLSKQNDHLIQEIAKPAPRAIMPQFVNRKRKQSEQSMLAMPDTRKGITKKGKYELRKLP